MKISLVIIVTCITIAMSAGAVEPYGVARGYHPNDQRAQHYFQPDVGLLVGRL